MQGNELQEECVKYSWPFSRRISAFQYLKGVYKKAGEQLFTWADGGWTRGNGFKLEERFRFDVMKKFFTQRVARTGCPEKLWVPHPWKR